MELYSENTLIFEIFATPYVDKSVVKIPSILHYIQRDFMRQSVWLDMLGSAIFFMDVMSITKLHIISHNVCIEEDICLQFNWASQMVILNKLNALQV